MVDDRVVVEIVSEFFLNTSQRRRRLNVEAVSVMMACSPLADLIQRFRERITGFTTSVDDADSIALSTGSRHG